MNKLNLKSRVYCIIFKNSPHFNSFLVQCDDLTTCNGNGTCIGNTGKCDCNSGFTGDLCDIVTCPGKPICSGRGTCAEGGTVCVCDEEAYSDDCAPGLKKQNKTYIDFLIVRTKGIAIFIK